MLRETYTVPRCFWGVICHCDNCVDGKRRKQKLKKPKKDKKDK